MTSASPLVHFWSTSEGVLYLVIRNAGASVARNLQVTFKPEITTLRTDAQGQRTAASFIRDRYFADHHDARSGRVPDEPLHPFANDTGTLPWQIEVLVVYEDDRGRPYRDPFPLFVDAQAQEAYAKLGGDEWDKNLAYAAESAAWELWKR